MKLSIFLYGWYWYLIKIDFFSGISRHWFLIKFSYCGLHELLKKYAMFFRVVMNGQFFILFYFIFPLSYLLALKVLIYRLDIIFGQWYDDRSLGSVTCGDLSLLMHFPCIFNCFIVLCLQCFWSDYLLFSAYYMTIIVVSWMTYIWFTYGHHYRVIYLLFFCFIIVSFFFCFLHIYSYCF